MEIAAPKEHRDGVRPLAEHVGDVVGEIQGSVGGDFRLQRDPRIGEKRRSGRVVSQARNEIIVSDLAAVDGHLEPAKSADKCLRTDKSLSDSKFLSEYGCGVVRLRNAVILP